MTLNDLIMRLTSMNVPRNAWDKNNVRTVGKFELCVENAGDGYVIYSATTLNGNREVAYICDGSGDYRTDEKLFKDTQNGTY